MIKMYCPERKYFYNMKQTLASQLTLGPLSPLLRIFYWGPWGRGAH